MEIWKQSAVESKRGVKGGTLIRERDGHIQASLVEGSIRVDASGAWFRKLTNASASI
jgi:hypothetical protein